MKTTLLIPTRNEIDGMRTIMPRVNSGWVDQIVVVDGGSTDGTPEYARANGYTVVPQKDPTKRQGYYGDAMDTCTGDVIITFSPDGNSIPELIPELVKKMKEGFDMVIASRYLPGAGSEDDDTITWFGNRLFTGMVRTLYGATVTDTLVMLRAWKKSIGAPIAHLPEFEARIVIECAKRKLKIAEIPGREPKRVGGVRKMRPLVNGWEILKVIVTERFSTSASQNFETARKEAKPVHPPQSGSRPDKKSLSNAG